MSLWGNYWDALLVKQHRRGQGAGRGGQDKGTRHRKKMTWQELLDTPVTEVVAREYGNKYRDAFGRLQTSGVGRHDIEITARAFIYAYEHADEMGLRRSARADAQYRKLTSDQESFYNKVRDSVLRRKGIRR